MAIPVIGLYNGASPPANAYLCNGNACALGATPDCRDRWVIGAGSGYSLNGTGGATTKQLADHVHVMASHGHTSTLYMQSAGSGTSLHWHDPSIWYNIGGSSHLHYVSWRALVNSGGNIAVAGATAALENRPPYYGLTYIMFDGSILPVGAIVWCNTAIPGHFALCNGGSGTPNLMDRVMLAAGSSYGLGWGGGENTNTPASHTHTFNAHQHNLSGGTGAGQGSTVYCSSTSTPLNRWGASANHTHEVTGTTSTATPAVAASNSAAVSNLPPYIALYPVMKIS